MVIWSNTGTPVESSVLVISLCYKLGETSAFSSTLLITTDILHHSKQRFEVLKASDKSGCYGMARPIITIKTTSVINGLSTFETIQLHQ